MSIGRKAGNRTGRGSRNPRRPFCEAMERRELLSALEVTRTADDGNPGSLRWAIQQANAGGSGASIQIDFDIATGASPLVIQLASPLPAIDVPVTIDGTTEPGYRGSPLIEISGAGLKGAGNNGLVIVAGGSAISGLSLVGFSGSAIVLQTGNGSVISGNDLGITPSGSAATPNQQGITLAGSSNNTIGALTGGAGNVISGNAADGILIESAGGGSGSGNMVVGNLIGTSFNGQQAIPNGAAGIDIDGAGGNLIGLPGQGVGNVISGNGGPGIIITGDASGNTIQNDLIGVAIDAVTPLGNQGDGVDLNGAPQTVVGGADPSERNIIAANEANGIATAGNTTGTLIEGNAIGTDASGSLLLGNQLNGVCLASSANTVGGIGQGAANVIAFNGSGRVGAGVQLVGSANEDSILGNSMVGNAGLGINLGSGPTPNHAPGTPGPNDYQNYPVLSLAQDDGVATMIDGTLSEEPNTQYLIQFFTSPQPDPSGYGQGKTYLGSATVETDANGNATFTTGLPPASAGTFLSATATDPLGNTSEFSGDIAVGAEIDLVLSGTAAPVPVLDGGDLTYTLTVANDGTAEADDVTVTDQLPAGVTLVSQSVSQGRPFPDMGPGTVAADLGTIEPGASATVTIVVQTGAGAIGTIDDTATVSSEETDPDPADESVSISATVETAADVAVALSGTPATVLAGADVTYTMTVDDLGPQGASGVTAVLPLGPGLTFVSASTPVGTATMVGGQVVADLGNLAAGQQVAITVVAQATAAGSVKEAATVSSQSLDPDLSNNTSSVTTAIVPAADLEVQVSADATAAADGVPLIYTVTVTNNGPSVATGVTLTNVIPSGVTVESVSANGGTTPTIAGGVLNIAYPTLASGASTTVTIAVNPAATAGSTLVDTATVQGAQADPDPADGTSTLTLPVVGSDDLAVTATAGPGPTYYAGQRLTYTVTVTNNGPDDEPDAVLSSIVPPDLMVDATTSSVGADPPVSQGDLTANLGPIPAGQSVVVTLVVTPNAVAVGPLTMGFSVQGQDVDTDPSNNSVGVTVPVAPASDLGVAIVPATTDAVAQVDWTYTVQVTNAGPSAATGVIATIPVPAGVTLVSAVPSQGLAAVSPNGNIVADLGGLASGASASIIVVIDPSASVSGGSVSLAAQVSGAQYDPDTANNQTTLNLAVAQSVAVAMTMGSTPQVVPSGQVVTFTALVSNVGPTPATGVRVAFPQLNGLQFLATTPSQGTADAATGQYFANLGQLNPGQTATVALQALATTAGNYTMTATVTQDEFNIDLSSATATTTAQVVESPGIVELGTGSVVVTDQSGMAVVPVVRLYGAAGTITVQYQAIGVNATPGTDFTPTSGTLTLGPGQTTATIQVPVLDDPYLNHDTYLNLTIGSPAGGAVLGPTTTALVHIQDVDPDLTPPQVSNLSWSGSSQAITAIALQFSAPLNPSVATDAADYLLNSQVGGRAIAIGSISYNPTSYTVTIVPASPIASGQFTRIMVIGGGPDGVQDIAGNLLDGAGNGVAGSDYAAEFGQGTRLTYVDDAQNKVTVRVTGPGYLEQVLDGNGAGVSLDLVGMVPHRTAIRGKIKAGKRGSGQTQIGLIKGLGQFGDVKVLLKTPPFRVTQFPFQRRGKDVL